MALDFLTQAKVNDWLAAKCGSHACPTCGHQVWDASTFAVPETLDDPIYAEPGSVKRAPLLLVSCMNCGYTKLFSAAVMG